MAVTEAVVKQYLTLVKEALKEPGTYMTFISSTNVKAKDIDVDNCSINFGGRVGKLAFKDEGSEDVFLLHVYKQLI